MSDMKFIMNNDVANNCVMKLQPTNTASACKTVFQVTPNNDTGWMPPVHTLIYLCLIVESYQLTYSNMLYFAIMYTYYTY